MNKKPIAIKIGDIIFGTLIVCSTVLLGLWLGIWAAFALGIM